MQLVRGILGYGYGLSILFTMVVLLGCGGGDPSTAKDSADQSATLSFQLNFTPPDNPSSPEVIASIGEPDVCRDYQVDRITVQVHRAQDSSQVASAQGDCANHTLTVTNVPADEDLFVVCKGSIRGKTVWQGQKDNVVATGGRNNDIGKINMTYTGTDTEAPEIVSTFPTTDATDVDLRTWIVVTFNEPLATSSIPDNAITVLANDNPVAGQVTYDLATNTIRFAPDAPGGLDTETTYTASLQSQDTDGNRITDSAGQPFSGERQWQFTTRGTTDTSPPQVIAVSPVNSSVDISQQTAVTVQFSEPMDAESFSSEVLQLSSGQGAVKGGIVYNAQNRTLTLTPELSLTAATLYTAVVSTQGQDTSQNPLLAGYTWQFRTMASRYDLHVTKTGSGRGTVTSPSAGIDCGTSCQTKIDQGTTVTLEANADESSTFKGWSGDVCDGATNPCTFTMVATETTVTANFSVHAYTISTSVIPEDGSGGTISPTNAAVPYGEDRSFEITTNPYYHLSELLIDGNPVALADTYLFENVTSDRVIEAVFKVNAISVAEDFVNIAELQINANGLVVWQGKKENDPYYEIYLYDAGNPQGPKNISQNSAGNDESPQINERGQVVWCGRKESDSTFRDIYYYDTSNPQVLENISNSPLDEWGADINKNGEVVWVREMEPHSQIFYYDILNPQLPPKNISNDTDINNNPLNNNPQINANGQIVWERVLDIGFNMSNIFFYDDSNPQEPVSISQGHMYSVHKGAKMNADGQVVWECVSEGGDESQICFYDASKPQLPINISQKSGSYELDNVPQINAKGQVVWCGLGRDSDLDDDIYYYDASNPQLPIKLSQTATSDDDAPQINANGQVVWHGSNGSNHEIYFYDTSNAQESINISNNSADDDMPQINAIGQVVWRVCDSITKRCEVYFSSVSQ